MRCKLLALFVLVAGVACGAKLTPAQERDHCRCHLGVWLHRAPPEYCCPPEWRWISIHLRAYPNSTCQGWKGTLEPYDENGLMLPPTSRPGMLPLTDPQGDMLTPPKEAKRTGKMQTHTISTRK